jgi:hypothetical protein
VGILNRIFLGHRIDQWASENILNAARVLNHAACEVIAEAEKEIEQVGWQESLTGQSKFISERIAPLVRSVAEPVALDIIADANITLQDIVLEHAVWTRSPEYSEQPDGAFSGSYEVMSAAVPLAAGAAVASALPFAALTTTTALFGLVTTTVISWPVVVGGGAIAGAGIALGLLNTATLTDKLHARLRLRVRSFVLASLIEGDARNPSILQQISAEFISVAKRAKT